jgi:hypothetical protein
VTNLTGRCAAPRQILHPAKAGIQDDAIFGGAAGLALYASFLNGVILKGLQAVKDPARTGRNPRLDTVPERPQTRPDAPQMLHPAKAGIQDDAYGVAGGGLLAPIRLCAAAISGRSACTDTPRVPPEKPSM